MGNLLEENCVFLDKSMPMQPELYLLRGFRSLQPFCTTSGFFSRSSPQVDVIYRRYITTQHYSDPFTQIYTKSS